MTVEEVRSLWFGMTVRERDAWVAKHVFKCNVKNVPEPWHYNCGCKDKAHAQPGGILSPKDTSHYVLRSLTSEFMHFSHIADQLQVPVRIFYDKENYRISFGYTAAAALSDDYREALCLAALYYVFGEGEE